MRLLSLLPAALTGLALGFASDAAAADDTTLERGSSSFNLVQGQPSWTFDYSTSEPQFQNWIGIYYAAGGGPVNQEFESPSLTFEYAKESSGRVTISSQGFEPGRYKAYFLAKNKYGWLANPIDIYLAASSGSNSFLVDDFTTHNAKQGTAFSADIGGLLSNGAADANTQFTKTSSNGGDWVRISSTGILSGTPPSSGNTQITVVATGSNGSRATLRVTIPVRSSGSTLVQDLTALTFNLWEAGRRVNNGHQKQVKFLVSSGSDVVGLQETTGGAHASTLAQSLGWYSWQSEDDIGIISRYPIVKVYPTVNRGAGVRIQLDGRDSEVILWNTHLGYTPYGPYDFCFEHLTLDKVIENETNSGRTPQIRGVMNAMDGAIRNADNVPVLLTGDFNAPSHLDWVGKTSDSHCGQGYVPWPSSKLPVEGGLVDSYREMHYDPLSEPGITWSPIYLYNTNYQAAEPLDRIDFIYYRGKALTATSSDAMVVGSPRAQPNQQDNEWPSDHRAVRTVFHVNK